MNIKNKKVRRAWIDFTQNNGQPEPVAFLRSGCPLHTYRLVTSLLNNLKRFTTLGQSNP